MTTAAEGVAATPTRVLLVSTYALGQQPLELAQPAAALRAAGCEVRCVDTSVEELDEATIGWADRVAFSVPMHTAMRLALGIADAVRATRPGAPLCFFGLYAGLARELTVRSAADAAIAGEYEPGLVAWAMGADPGPPVQLGRIEPVRPARDLLPPLERYARLVGLGDERLVGAVAASRGCSHRCRHCPVPVVYDGRVRPADLQACLADVEQVIAAGARHLTFTDPDFLNVPHHARRVVAAVRERHPDVSFDCTVKVEHLRRWPDVVADLAAGGCAFVVSAFESTDDAVLRRLDKGHTVKEASQAVRALRRHGMEIRPSWLPFTPWTTLDDLVDLVGFVVAHDLVRNVDPVQYTVRLLLPEGSLLLDDPTILAHTGPYDPARLGVSWAHDDPAVDALQEELAELVEGRMDADPEATFDEIEAIVRTRAGGGRRRPALGEVSRGGPVRPRSTEAWFCCSEPTRSQQAPVTAGAGATALDGSATPVAAPARIRS